VPRLGRLRKQGYTRFKSNTLRPVRADVLFAHESLVVAMEEPVSDWVMFVADSDEVDLDAHSDWMR
jgi:hypothetical protein